MNIPPLMTRKSCNASVKVITVTMIDVANSTMKEAADKIKMKKGTNDIAVSTDET